MEIRPAGAELILLYPVRTRWGTYLGYCSRRDGARNSG